MRETPGRLTVGNVDVVSLTDAEVVYPYPLAELFPGVRDDDWTPYRERYPLAFSGQDRMHTHWGSYLLRSQGRTILIDTGAGQGPDAPALPAVFGGIEGRLMDELRGEGVRPEEIDTVFFTHLHPDHVGWNLTRKGGAEPTLTFPKARYVASQADWAHFKKPEVQAHLPFSYVNETIAPLFDLGALDLVEGEQALTGEIKAIPTPGHTPGHMSLLISSNGHKAMILGDVAVHPAQVTEVGWNIMFDADTEQAPQTRQKIVDQLESEGITVAACHFPAPGFGRIITLQGRRYWQGL